MSFQNDIYLLIICVVWFEFHKRKTKTKRCGALPPNFVYIMYVFFFYYASFWCDSAWQKKNNKNNNNNK